MKTIFALLRWILKLRYSVTIKNGNLLDGLSQSILLPNHQAIVDPQLLLAHIYRKTEAIPAITSSFYDMPLLNTFFARWGAVRVDDLEKGSRNINVLNEITGQFSQALKVGKNVIIYPAGQLSDTAFEMIKNKQSAYTLAQVAPAGTKIIGVRISGLWGSRWSRFHNGKTPDFLPTFITLSLWCLANFIFFMPRRKVVIEFEDISEQAFKQQDQKAFNSFLEDFYNRNVLPDPQLKRIHFLAPAPKRHNSPHIKPQRQEEKKVARHRIVHHEEHESKNATELSEDEIPEIIKKTVTEAIAETLNLQEPVLLATRLTEDYGIDSLDLINIIESIEQKLGIAFPQDIERVKTAKHLCILAMGHEQVHIEYKPVDFRKFHAQEMISINAQSTIGNEARKMLGTQKSDILFWDSMLGNTTRKDVLLKAYVIAQLIKSKTQSQYVGIMLPSLQTTPLLILATYLAGKIPVMFNWTVGQQNMEQCFAISQTDCILTASAFFDKVADRFPQSLEKHLCFLDQEIPHLKTPTKLTGALNYALRRNTAKQKPGDIAVVLFTSGSETAPKPVPLTHKNILSDLHATFGMVGIPEDQIFLSFLPPFHSFGFALFCILPLVTGCRVAYTPDPTNADEIIRVLEHTRANLVIGTPTFIRNILSRATAEQLKSINFLVSGAESMPEAVAKLHREKTPNAHLLEGYGITECSPILSLNPLDKQKTKSVGIAIPGVSYLLADPETHAIVHGAQEGLLLVSGDNVFGGYLDSSIKSPFISVEGTQYYNTGDIVSIDSEGYIFITGRQKRFLKSGGEMLSLPYLEEIIAQEFGSDEDPVLAVEGIETQSGAVITLFASIDLQPETVNAFLQSKGIGSVYRIKKFEILEHIPLLGSGKIDYRTLKEMCKKHHQ